MRHRKAKGRLGRPKGARDACVRNTVINLLTFGRITTTKARAKEAKRLAERLITLAKLDNLSNTRQVASLLGNDRKLTHNLFREIAPRFKNRCGGYTRIIQKGRRSGDNACLVILELTEQKKKKEPPKAIQKEEPKLEPQKEEKIERAIKKLKPAKREPKLVEKKPKEKFFRRIFKRERDSL